MPKRKSIFEECPLQCKMHIGIKEVNLGVNCETNMKKVYDRTHKLLFNGATEHNSVFNGKSNGHVNGNELNGKQTLNVQELKSKSNGCCDFSANVLCSFCEKPVPFNCYRMCNMCSMKFCHLCSVLQYGTQEETSVCLSCL